MSNNREIMIIPVKYDRTKPETDFNNMINDIEQNKTSLYLFNDNNDHHYSGNIRGGGNAFLRIMNWHSNYTSIFGKPLSAGISTGYNIGEAFTQLDYETKRIIDRDFNDIYYILMKYPEINKIYYSIGVNPYSDLYDLIEDNDDCIVLPDGYKLLITDNEKNNILGQSIFSVSENVRGYITKKIWELAKFHSNPTNYSNNINKSILSRVNIGDNIE